MAEKYSLKKDVVSTTELAINNLLGYFGEKNKNGVKYEELINKLRNNEENYKLPNPYFSIIFLDGDKMGEWISGKKSPDLLTRLQQSIPSKDIDAKKIYEDFCKDKNINLNVLKRSSITPSYHKAVTRTLDHFSSFIKSVVEYEFNGLLIYSGGDDVLAFVPAINALKCANKIRQIYSGNGRVEVIKDDKKYVFRDETCYLTENGNEIPLFPMMGKKATMSCGIAIVNHKFPLYDALDIARKAEKRAKKNDRKSFAVSLVKHSGQQEEITLKWEIEGNDVLDVSEDIWNEIKKDKMSRKLLYMLLDEKILDELDVDEYINYYFPYILNRRTIPNKEKDSRIYKKYIDKFNTIFKESRNDKKLLIQFLKTISIFEFTQRGVK